MQLFSVQCNISRYITTAWFLMQHFICLGNIIFICATFLPTSFTGAPGLIIWCQERGIAITPEIIGSYLRGAVSVKAWHRPCNGMGDSH